MKRYKSIFFDFDGVIVDSVDIKTKAFYELYKPYSEEAAQKVMAYHIANGGLSRFKKIRYAHQHFLGEEISDSGVQLLADKFAKMVEEAVVKCRFMEGALETLQRLSAKHPLAVISGTPETELKRILERRELTKYFQWIYGAPRSKADAFQDILSLSGMKAPEVLFIGDSLNDYDAAKEVGIPFFGIGSQPFPAGVTVLKNLSELN